MRQLLLSSLFILFLQGTVHTECSGQSGQVHGIGASSSSKSNTKMPSSSQSVVIQQPVPITLTVKTSPESSSITDKHPWAVYFIIIAAALAAIASIISSIITGWLTLKSKNREYKNGYYMKVIEKRIKAIEAAEELAAFFSRYREGKKGKFFLHFISEIDGNRLSAAVDKVAMNIHWYNEGTAKKIAAFAEKILAVGEGVKNMDATAREDFCVDEYESIKEMVIDLRRCIGNDMYTLYDVDKFFQTRASKDVTPKSSVVPKLQISGVAPRS